MAAIASVALASCSNEEFVGEENSPGQNGTQAIAFGGGFKAVTRAESDHVGADAANMLGGKFIVSGFKGENTQATNLVFDNYLVEWGANTAGKTTSNTTDWEYVGKTSPVTGTTRGTQTIKYWDYSQALYDFIAYSPGDNEVITSGSPSNGQVLVTPIDATTAETAAYTIKGGETELSKCYIADRVTVTKQNYMKDVVITFRALTAKVRVGIYETIPGYSVKNVTFHQASNDAYTTAATQKSATLIGSFNTGGLFTVKYNDQVNTQMAHVSITNQGYTPGTFRGFGNLTYGDKERYEKGNPVENSDPISYNSEVFLKRAANTPSYANNGVFTTVLPVESSSSVMELYVDYVLESIDGSGETITVHGAKAFVPAVFTQWLPNYAYTYLFKISDNTNGWTSTVNGDPAGLYPITFDAVVVDSEEKNQSTITTVATPSITAYQKGRDLTTDEFATGDIYIQVMNDGTLVNNLANSNSYFYSLSAAATEADVMDALNIRESESEGTITGRNALVLTPATISNTVEAIPGEDGNNITVTSGEAAKLTTSTGGTYAYVYDYTNGTPQSGYVYTAVQLTGESAPNDFTTKYFKKNVDGTFSQCVANDYDEDGYFYTRYTDLKHTYGVKIIKVVAAQQSGGDQGGGGNG